MPSRLAHETGRGNCESRRAALYSAVMSRREGSGWSRTWASVAMLAFALHLGAALYELVVVYPLWSHDLPKSVAAWTAMNARPDSTRVFTPLVVAILFSTGMAWISGITTRGWRRGWLTLALLAAAGSAQLTWLQVLPVERELFGPAALGAGTEAIVIGLTGDWIRWSAIRLVVLLAGAWLVWTAQLSGGVSDSGRGTAPLPEPGPDRRGSGRGKERRRPEFSLGDLAEPEVSFGDETPNARDQWRRSLPPRRRTAKK